ncbi:MAG: hypothetical protein WC269_01790 [Candidatus Gracilibacteria bacterium]|jgi:hypothetical protein
MPQNGEIDLNEVKAKYSLQDITLVDSREIDYANEARLYAEIGFAIGLTFSGAILTEFNWVFAIAGGVFLLFGLINAIRYLFKLKKIKSVSPINKLET